MTTRLSLFIAVLLGIAAPGISAFGQALPAPVSVQQPFSIPAPGQVPPVPSGVLVALGMVAPGQAPPAPVGAPIVNVQVVLSRFEGEKRVSSHPYTLTLVPGKPGSLRNGAEVAIPTTTFSPGGDKPSATSYTMQQIGTQIDCTARPLGEDRYELSLTVTDRSVYPTAQTNQLGVPTVANVPTFKNVTSASTLVLRNGQSIQFTASTDKVTGEVFRVDVTLTVPK